MTRILPEAPPPVRASLRPGTGPGRRVRDQSPSAFSEPVRWERCRFLREGLPDQAARSLIVRREQSARFFVYPAAWFFFWDRAGPGLDTSTPRSHMRGFDSSSYFDVRVFLKLSRISCVRSRCLHARCKQEVSERSGPPR